MEKKQTKLNRKYIGVGSLALTGILYILSGIAFLIWRKEIPPVLRYSVFGYGIVLSISNLLACFSKFSITRFMNALLPAIFGFVFLTFSGKVTTLYTFFIGTYILLIGIIKFIDYLLQRADQTPGRSVVLFNALIIIGMSLPIFLNPATHTARVSIITGIFCIFYGITVLGDFLVEILPMKQTDRIKQRIRLNLPVFLTALMPKQAITHINSLLEVSDDGIIEEESFKVEKVPDIEIFVHVTEKGTGTMGHSDFCFEGKVYCYGNYDDASFKLFGAIGDGVLFTTTDRDRYIQFCADETGDSIFAFGLSLTEVQKQAIRDQIKELFTHVVPWQAKIVRYGQGTYVSEKEPTDYASNLYRETHASMYKFKNTSFKTYFVLATNCVKLVDYVVRSSGVSGANPNGIMTPGAYYEFLDRQYRMKNSIVISKQTYHHDAPIEHSM